MDRAGADFMRVVEQIRGLPGTCVPIPLNMGAEENYVGVIDLIKMKAINWNPDDQGMTFTYDDIPAEHFDEAGASFSRSSCGSEQGIDGQVS